MSTFTGRRQTRRVLWGLCREAPLKAEMGLHVPEWEGWENWVPSLSEDLLLSD